MYEYEKFTIDMINEEYNDFMEEIMQKFYYFNESYNEDLILESKSESIDKKIDNLEKKNRNITKQLNLFEKIVNILYVENKDLVKRYHNKIMKKLESGVLDSMEIVASEYFFNNKRVDKIDIPKSSCINDFTDKIKKCKSEQEIVDTILKWDREKIIEQKNYEIVKEKGIKKVMTGKEISDILIGKDIKKKGYTKAMNDDIEKFLNTFTEFNTYLIGLHKKSNKECNETIKFFKDLKSQVESIKETSRVTFPALGIKVEISKITALSFLTFAISCAYLDLNIYSYYYQYIMMSVEKLVKESRAVYIKAANYKGVKEDALLDFIDEATSYEVDLLFNEVM